MKTIHKKAQGKTIKPENHVHKILVEDPSGHHHFEEASKSQNISVLSDLIQLKRVKYHKGKSASLLISSISLCLSLLFVIGMFEWKTHEKGSEVDLELTTQQFEDLIDVPLTKQPEKAPPQAQAPVIIEVRDEEIIEEIEINLDIEMTEETRIAEVIYEKTEDGALPEEVTEEIFTIVEVQPSPVGGIKAFYDFVGSNLEYPAKARRMGIEGRVFVEFVVEKDGSLTDIKVAKGVGGGCDEEAIRVISQAPDWNPGKQRGNAVRVRMIMPLMFKLLD